MGVGSMSKNTQKYPILILFSAFINIDFFTSLDGN